MTELQFDLPEDIEIEAEVIGFALNEERGYAVAASLTPDDFAVPLHRQVWAIIQDIAAGGIQPNPVTLSAELDARKLPRDVVNRAIADYGHRPTCLMALPSWVAALKDLSKRRRALLTLPKLAETLQQRDRGAVAEDQIGKTVADLVGIAGDERRLVGLDELGDGYMAGECGRISPTGFRLLDKALAGGFHQNRFYGISGKMKAGKTMFLGTISQNMVALTVPHVYLCLEMRAEEIGRRYYARQMGVNALAFYNKAERNEPWFVRRLAQAREHFRENNFVKFLPRPRMDLDDLRATIASIALSGTYHGVFVDYVQLVGGQGRNQNETNHLDNVNQTLAEMAARYPLWICAGAQQNDDGGVRGGKGMAAACDVLFGIEDSDPEDSPCVDGNGNRRQRRHLTMQFSRYTLQQDIGEPNRPGYELRTDIGPYFEEL